MIEYKKEAPKIDPWNAFVTDSQRIQHYCGLIVEYAVKLNEGGWTKEDKQQILNDIIHFTRSLWDLVPEEEFICKADAFSPEEIEAFEKETIVRGHITYISPPPLHILDELDITQSPYNEDE